MPGIKNKATVLALQNFPPSIWDTLCPPILKKIQVYGSVFITTIIFSPIFGKYIGHIGSRRLFIYGTFVAGNYYTGCPNWIVKIIFYVFLIFALYFQEQQISFLVSWNGSKIQHLFSHFLYLFELCQQLENPHSFALFIHWQPRYLVY